MIIRRRPSVRRLPVPAQIWTNHSESRRKQRGDEVPCGVRAWMAVEEHDRWPGAAMTYPKHGLADVDPVE